MFVEWPALARELGTTGCHLRILVGLPTRLQKLIRKARTFEEVTALSGEFESDRYSYDNCGPKFEPEEKTEYLARREELFPAYLAKFTTAESFRGFGRVLPNQYRSITTEEENAAATDAFVAIFMARAAETLSAPDQKLQGLVALHTEASTFLDNNRDEVRGVNPSAVLQHLNRAIGISLLDELNTAHEAQKSLTEVLAIFKKVGLTYSRDLFVEIFSWQWVWDEAPDVASLLEIETCLGDRFSDSAALERRLAALVRAEIEEKGSFIEAAEYGQRFAGRDRPYQPSQVYGDVLTALAKKASTQDELNLVIRLYRKRQGMLDSSTRDRYNTPHYLNQKWDNLNLEKAKTEKDLTKLAEILNDAPASSETFRAASKRLNDHFDTLLENAEDEAAVDLVEKKAEKLSRHIHLLIHHRKEAIKKKAHAKRISELWEIFESGVLFEDEKTVLKGLFHQFDKVDPDRARLVLLRLMKHFPAEDVEDVQVEV